MGPTAKNRHEASMQSNRKRPCNQIESIDTIYVTVQRKFCRNSILRPPGPQYSSCLSSPWSFLTSISTNASCLQDANPKVGVEVTLRVQALKNTWQWGLTNKIYIMSESISYIKTFHSTTLLYTEVTLKDENMENSWKFQHVHAIRKQSSKAQAAQKVLWRLWRWVNVDHDVKNAWGINGSNIVSCKLSQSGRGHSQEMHCTSTGREICQNLNLFQILAKLEGIKAIRTKSHDSHSVVCILPAGPLSLLPHSSAALTICSLRAQLLHHTLCFASPNTPLKPEVECKALLAAKAHLAQASASLSENSVSDQWRWQCFASKSIKYDGYTTRTSKDRTGPPKMK